MPTPIPNTWLTCPPAAYYDILTLGDASAAEAAYYLLRHRLSKRLAKVFDAYGFGLIDDYNDTIDDFFLYLHGLDADLLQKPFSILSGIRDRNAFFAWVISTYRIFLLKKAKAAEQEKAAASHPFLTSTNIENQELTDEQMTRFIANAIAFADQQFVTLKRFVFYRLLLSFLNHRMAIPQEEMAKALNMNAVTYRVYTKRQKDRFLEWIKLQEAGGTLLLNPQHEAMRDDILSRFNQLYMTLREYYGRTLMDLPKADEVTRLRMEYSQGRDAMMHEETPNYGFTGEASLPIDASALYHDLKAYLKRQS